MRMAKRFSNGFICAIRNKKIGVKKVFCLCSLVELVKHNCNIKVSRIFMHSISAKGTSCYTVGNFWMHEVVFSNLFYPTFFADESASAPTRINFFRRHVGWIQSVQILRDFHRIFSHGNSFVLTFCKKYASHFCKRNINYFFLVSLRWLDTAELGRMVVRGEFVGWLGSSRCAFGHLCKYFWTRPFYVDGHLFQCGHYTSNFLF